VNRRILIITVLVALVVLASNWLSNRREQKQATAVTAAAHVPDYFLRDFTATTMNPQGKPEQRLTAQLMEHYGNDNSMDLTAPHLTLFQSSGPPWLVVAARGRIIDGGKEVVLSGGVRMDHDAQGTTMTLTTDHLLLRPKQRYAETDAAVTVTTPQGRVDAVGMQADMATQRLQLLSKVRGTYAPQTH